MGPRTRGRPEPAMTISGVALRRPTCARSPARPAVVPPCPGTFRNKDLWEHIAPLLGMMPSQLSPGRVTYDLRRLRLHGLIERIPKTHCYRITAKGLRTAIFYTRLYNRSLRTGFAVISPDAANANLPLTRSIRAAEAALNTWYDKANLAA